MSPVPSSGELSTTRTSTARPASTRGSDRRHAPISSRDLYATITIDSSGNSGVDTSPRCEMLAAKAMSAPPVLSVIVLARAAEPALAPTLASIREQRDVAPELIVIELADSTATALNAGVAAAHGDWVLFLDAG